MSIFLVITVYVIEAGYFGRVAVYVQREQSNEW